MTVCYFRYALRVCLYPCEIASQELAASCVHVSAIYRVTICLENLIKQLSKRDNDSMFEMI